MLNVLPPGSVAKAYAPGYSTEKANPHAGANRSAIPIETRKKTAVKGLFGPPELTTIKVTSRRSTTAVATGTLATISGKNRRTRRSSRAKRSPAARSAHTAVSLATAGWGAAAHQMHMNSVTARRSGDATRSAWDCRCQLHSARPGKLVASP